MLTQKLDILKLEEKEVKELYREAYDAAKEMTTFERQKEQLLSNIEKKRQMLDLIVKQLTNANLVKNVGGFDARTIAPPTPGRKVAPAGSLVLVVAGFLGLLFSLGLIYLAEITDRSFRTPEEVGRRLNMPVVGYIPKLSASEKAAAATEDGLLIHPSLRTHHRPRGRGSGSLSSCPHRSLIREPPRQSGPRVCSGHQFRPGDGKTTLACNLAVTIAQSGKRALLD